MTDLISRADAMGAVQDHFNADGFKGYDDGQKMMDRIKALPSVVEVKEEKMIKAEWTNKDSLDLQPTCNQLATNLQQWTGDIISRADAIDAVCRTRCGDKAKGCPAHSCLVIEEFDALPSADAEQGEWIDDKPTLHSQFAKQYRCSKCGARRYKDNFCPNCGADMRGGEDE